MNAQEFQTKTGRAPDQDDLELRYGELLARVVLGILIAVAVLG